MATKILTKKLIEWNGIDQMVKRVDKLRKRISAEGLKETFVRAALVVRDEARDLVPKHTGLLRDSIFAGSGDPKKPNALVGVNQRKAPHAHWIEYGTSKMEPRPFMRPAIRAARPTAAKIIAEGIEQAIQQELK